MPNAPLSPCPVPGCDQLTRAGKCDLHSKQYDRSLSRAGREVYRSPRWRSLTRQVKKEQPWCAIPGCTNMTHDVDHKVALRDGGAPYDRDNVWGLCHKHHSAKTASEVWHRT